MDRDMGAKLEMWRAADRAAHDAEQQIRSFGNRYRGMVTDEDLKRARELRTNADQLFEEAMFELNRELSKAIALQSSN